MLSSRLHGMAIGPYIEICRMDRMVCKPMYYIVPIILLDVRWSRESSRFNVCMNHFRINNMYTVLETRRRGHLAKECIFCIPTPHFSFCSTHWELFRILNNKYIHSSGNGGEIVVYLFIIIDVGQSFESILRVVQFSIWNG